MRVVKCWGIGVERLGPCWRRRCSAIHRSGARLIRLLFDEAAVRLAWWPNNVSFFFTRESMRQNPQICDYRDFVGKPSSISRVERNASDDAEFAIESGQHVSFEP
jgi:hypothetical protein